MTQEETLIYKALQRKRNIEQPQGQRRMDNREKLATLGTKDEYKHQQHSTIYAEHYPTQNTRRRKKQKVGTQYVLDTTMRKQTQIK